MDGYYSFQVTFQGDLRDAEHAVDVLYGAGCNDATVSVERDGSAGCATFDREASDALAAVMSAVEDIEMMGFNVVAVGEDPVSVADVAQRTGRSQQAVSAWINGQRGPGGFPAARTDRHWGAVYSWAEVTEWLVKHGLGGVEPAAAETAAACAAVDAVLDARTQLRTLPSAAARRARRLLAV